MGDDRGTHPQRMLALASNVSRTPPRVLRSVAKVEDPLGGLAARAPTDAGAAAELVRRLAPAASRIVHGLAGPLPGHDDLVQEALIALLRALPRFQRRSSVQTFLYGVCVRVVRRHRRTGARLLRLIEALVTQAPPEPEPTDLGSERARAVRRILDRLPAKRREVLVLFEMEGKSAPEVAEILRIPQATVYTRLYHARRAFRRLAERAPELREDPDAE